MIITRQIWIETLEDYYKFCKLTEISPKCFDSKDFPMFAHFWEGATWSMSTCCFKEYYPDLEELSFELFTSPLYQTLNGA